MTPAEIAFLTNLAIDILHTLATNSGHDRGTYTRHNDTESSLRLAHTEAEATRREMQSIMGRVNAMPTPPTPAPTRRTRR